MSNQNQTNSKISEHYDLAQLEYYDFTKKIDSQLVSKFSQDVLSELTPERDLDTVHERQNLFRAMETFCGITGFRPFNDNEFHTFYRYYDANNFDSFPSELLLIVANFLSELMNLKNLLGNLSSVQLESLSSYVSSYGEYIIDFNPIVSEINSKITPKGILKDDSTPELQRTRRLMHSLKGNITSKLDKHINSTNANKFLQDSFITIKNGRFVLACKSNYKSYIDATLQDVSPSGKTFFVEPNDSIELNNEYRIAQIQEKEIEIQILAELTELIRSNLSAIFNSLTYYRVIIFYIELVYFYKNYKYTLPTFGKHINLENVHHPILKIDKGNGSIPININLETKLSIISGPNTGGKSATLKSIALNHLLAKSGLPIFADRAELINFEFILADIGDNQNIQDDLSTFSAHIVKTKQIIDTINKNKEVYALLVFDEPGTGTEPHEGANLAQATLEYIINNFDNTYCVITTHFTNIKQLAFHLEDAEIYSVEWDYQNMLPQYNIIKGISGDSNPIKIAQKLGLNTKIIDDAVELTKDYKNSIQYSIQEINDIKAELVRKENKLKQLENELKNRENRIKNDAQELQNKLNKKEIELLKETINNLENSKKLLKEVEKSKYKEDLTQITETVKKSQDKVEKLKDALPTKELKIGDIIFIPKYGKNATVKKVEQKSVILDIAGLSVTMNIKDLPDITTKQKTPQQNKQHVRMSIENTYTKSEINLIGMRTEDALDKLDKYLNTALLSNHKHVHIIHGRGTGTLKTMIHQYLRQDPRITSFELASNEDGGTAITIAKL